MALIKVIQEKRNYQIKFLNILLYSRKDNEEHNTIMRTWLCGLFYVKQNKKNPAFNFRLFGLKILNYKIYTNFEILYFLFLPIFVIKIRKKNLTDFLDKVIAKNPNYDEYYVFLSRSGEFYLLMHHFKELLQNNNSKNFLMVFCAKYHINICEMFYPDMPYIYMRSTDVPLISRGVSSINFMYKNKKFIFPTFEKYFEQVEENIRNKKSHYYVELKNHLGLKGKEIINYKISNRAKEKVQKIITCLLNNNFIFISPETLSNEPMEKDFWDILCKSFKAKGYEVFCNSMDFKNLPMDATSAFLTYEEAIELSKYAVAIIGMRSGFLECLSQNNVPLFVLYTDFPKRSGFKRLKSDKVLSGYSIKKLPNVNKDRIYEYDVNLYKNENQIIEEVLEKIQTIK